MSAAVAQQVLFTLSAIDSYDSVKFYLRFNETLNMSPKMALLHGRVSKLKIEVQTNNTCIYKRIDRALNQKAAVHMHTVELERSLIDPKLGDVHKNTCRSGDNLVFIQPKPQEYTSLYLLAVLTEWLSSVVSPSVSGMPLKCLQAEK